MTISVDFDDDGTADLEITVEQAKKHLRRIKIIVYTIFGCLAGLAGFLSQI